MIPFDGNYNCNTNYKYIYIYIFIYNLTTTTAVTTTVTHCIGQIAGKWGKSGKACGKTVNGCGKLNTKENPKRLGFCEEASKLFNPFNAPGLHCVGEVSNQQVNGGKSLPLFEMVTPAGRPNINTLEGWQKLAAERNRRCFIEDFGREPESGAELKAYVDRLCREAEVI